MNEAIWVGNMIITRGELLGFVIATAIIMFAISGVLRFILNRANKK